MKQERYSATVKRKVISNQSTKMNNLCRSFLVFALTILSGLTPLLGNDLSVSEKMLHYSNTKSEIYSRNFLPIYTSTVSYAFTYSTSRNCYFCLILKDKNNSLQQIKIKEEHPLLEYKTYGDFLVITSKINPSLDEFYVYNTSSGSLKSINAGNLIIVDGKVVSIVYPPHFSAEKKSVSVEVDENKVLTLPFSYYTIEKAGSNKVRITDYLNSTPRIDIDQTSIETDTSIVISI